MKNGISTNLDVTGAVSCFKSSGLDFIARYYSTTTSMPEKRVTSAEATAILGAGLMLGIFYEDGPDHVEYFTSARGQQDATNAFTAAIALGQPSGSAIYFTVDYNAPDADISGPIQDYFTGVSQGMEAASAGGAITFQVGVYGSGAVCNLIKDQAGLAKYSWLSESPAWNGTKTYAGWDAMQALPTADICGFTANPETYEENQAQDNFGGFASLDPTPGP